MERWDRRELFFIQKGLALPLEDPYARWDLDENAIEWIQSLINDVQGARALELTDAPIDDGLDDRVREIFAESLDEYAEVVDAPLDDDLFALAEQLRAAPGVRLVSR